MAESAPLEQALILSRIADFEATLRTGFMTQVFRVVGRSAVFAWV